jgi:two-component system, chemotaxis family, sensor kinase CheA
MAEDKRQKYLRIFQAEAAEHLKGLNEGLLLLEKDPGNAEVIHSILRSAHTLKGSSRMLGLTEIGEIAHKMEDLLKAVEESQLGLTAELTDLLLQGTDAITALVDEQAAGRTGAGSQDLVARLAQALSGPAAAPAPPVEAAVPAPETAPAKKSKKAPSKSKTETAPEPEPPLPPPPKVETAPEAPRPPAPPTPASEKPAEPRRVEMETVRVEAQRLDVLVDLAGELLINKIKLEGKGHQAKTMFEELEGLLNRWHDFFENGQRAEGRARLQELRSRLQEFYREISEDIIELDVNTQEMQTQALGLRMLPVSALFDEFPRLVRDLARSLGKEIELTISGQETELDKRMLEQLKGPLIHILRNACDHGIEAPEAREQRGKPRAGKIGLHAYPRGSNVVIEVTDDGAGMNPDRIREVALQRGLIDAKAAAEMKDEELCYLTLQPGFTTSAIITDLSGRGVGLDVVKTNIENLRGDLHLSSERGVGARITLTLPLTVAIINSLLVMAGDEMYALPLNFVEETARVRTGNLLTERGREVINLRGQVTPLVSLSELLGLAGSGRQGRLRDSFLHLVVLKFRGQHLALEVDKFIRDQEIIVKSLGAHLKSVRFISGATILRRGEPALILNVFDLFGAAESWRQAPVVREAEAERRLRVLVVDDSITTRIVEKNILERAGYQVHLAVSGEEAWDKAQVADYDLFVVDIEMPGMDGFELTGRLKAHERTKGRPVVFVTSRASDEDKRRAVAAGVQAYIVKGSFDQTVLLETVRTMIGEGRP